MAEYPGAPPSASSLGAWLLGQVQEIADAVRNLINSQPERDEEIKRLTEAVQALQLEAARSAKIQDVTSRDLEEAKLKLSEVERNLNGIKISRGQYKSRALKAEKESRKHTH